MQRLQLRTLALAPLAIVLLHGVAAGQAERPQPAAPAGANLYVAAARSTPVAAGKTTSSSFQLIASVGRGAAVAPAASANFKLAGGLASIDADLASFDAPLVFGSNAATSDWTGGSSISIYGFNFSDPSLAPDVAFEGVPATFALVLANTRIRAGVPVGLDATGNPLAYSELEVVNDFGTAARADAFVFRPSLATASVVRVGCTADLELRSEPFAVYQLIWGNTFPDFAVPIPPFEGALAVLAPTVALSPFLIAPADGYVRLPLPIPHDPGLGGATLNLQAFALTSFDPLEGGFTNLLSAPILP